MFDNRLVIVCYKLDGNDAYCGPFPNGDIATRWAYDHFGTANGWHWDYLSTPSEVEAHKRDADTRTRVEADDEARVVNGVSEDDGLPPLYDIYKNDTLGLNVTLRDDTQYATVYRGETPVGLLQRATVHDRGDFTWKLFNGDGKCIRVFRYVIPYARLARIAFNRLDRYTRTGL